MDREGERSVGCGDGIQPEQPAGRHDKLDVFKDGVEAEGGF
jgi:hypothetical protein